MASDPSFREVQYDLRPKKQVERRMLIDALQLLSAEGFSIRDYQYTGMGSIYFVDFALLHKFLGLRDMVSVEKALDYPRRVEFNRPFRLVAIEMCRVGDYLPRLSVDRQHLVWLDYDTVLSRELLGDVELAGTRLTPGSILLVTVDIEPPAGGSSVGSDSAQARELLYQEEAGPYVDPAWTTVEFGRSRISQTTALLVQRAVTSGMNGRADLSFFPLFHFAYADGHQMMTCGGMLASQRDKRRLMASALVDTPYVRRRFDMEPYEIRVPKLTRKERLYLDAHMPLADPPPSLDFELTPEEVRAYHEIYRFLPAYAELLL